MAPVFKRLSTWLTTAGLLVGCLSAASAQETSIPQPPAAGASLQEKFSFLTEFPTDNRLTRTNPQYLQAVDLSDSISIDSTSSTRFTLPSFWWTRDQLTPRLGGFRLVNNWLAYDLQNSPLRVVDVFLDSQTWGVLTYMEHYAVLMQFGSTARNYGYQLRLYRGGGPGAPLVGLQVCDFEQAALGAEDLTPSCYATIDLLTLQGLRSPNLDAD